MKVYLKHRDARSTEVYDIDTDDHAAARSEVERLYPGKKVTVLAVIETPAVALTLRDPSET